MPSSAIGGVSSSETGCWSAFFFQNNITGPRSVRLRRGAALGLVLWCHDNRHATFALALAAFKKSFSGIHIGSQLAAGCDIVTIGQNHLRPLQHHNFSFPIKSSGVARRNLGSVLEINFSTYFQTVNACRAQPSCA